MPLTKASLSTPRKGVYEVLGEIMVKPCEESIRGLGVEVLKYAQSLPGEVSSGNR